MQTHYEDINEPQEMVVHLLSLSYFYGDYVIPFHLMNTASQAYLSVKKGDIEALASFALRNWIDFDLLSEEKQTELEQIYKKIKDKYSEQLKVELAPLPSEFLNELGERALKFGRFKDAYSAFKSSGDLDKRVNQFLTEAIQILHSKEVTANDFGEDEFKQQIAKAADLVYRAVKLKNPFGNQFQKLGPNLHYHAMEAARKYAKYIEQSLFKEIIDFGIQFLIDDRSVDGKITSALSSGKIRREFLKQLAIRFSGGKERYKIFIENYKQAALKLKDAKTEKDFIEVQKTLLGRGTGDNEYFQFLQELSLEHPVGALLVNTQATPENKLYIAPTILKSGASLLEFLELA